MKKEQDLCFKALTKWGIESQLNQAVEEMAECIVAINHFKRKGSNVTEIELIEECVDVEIMLIQLRYIFNQKIWSIKFAEKIQRLEELLK